MPEPRLIGAAGQSRFRGCRLGHEIVRNLVNLRIHAGSAPGRPAVDEPAQFLLGLSGLDDLLDELRTIRAELADAERAWARSLEPEIAA